MLNKVIEWFTQLGRPKKKSKSIQWATVALSFVLATTLWLLVTLNSQSYITSITYPVKLNNLPELLQLTQEFPQEIEVITEGSGFKLLGQLLDFSRDTIEIDYFRYGREKYFLGADNLSLLNQNLPSGLRAIGTRPDSLSLRVVRKRTKRVKVVLDGEVVPAKSYRLVKPLVPKPDSVLVKGPEDLLEQVTEWKTIPFSFQNITEATTEYVPLDTNKPLEVIITDVAIKIVPMRFTEGVAKVRLFPINLPKGVTLRLSPEEVELRYLAPVSDYNNILPTDFQAEVDFEKINHRSKYIFPRFETPSQNVQIAEITPQRVSYLIIREK